MHKPSPLPTTLPALGRSKPTPMFTMVEAAAELVERSADRAAVLGVLHAALEMMRESEAEYQLLQLLSPPPAMH